MSLTVANVWPSRLVATRPSPNTLIGMPSDFNPHNLTTPQPNLLWLKKAQAIWRGVLTAEVLKFPHRRSDVIKSLLETAKRLEKIAPEDCIAIQGQVIAMLSVEVSQSRRTAYAAMRALSAISQGK